MTYADVRRELLNLGFDSSYEETPSLMTDSINRAMHELAVRFPLLGRCEIAVPPGRGFVRHDMRQLATDGFIRVEYLMLEDTSGYRRANGWLVEQRHDLLLPASQPGSYTVFYRRNPTLLSPDSPDTQELELGKDREHLLPLLAAWYLWEDDEPTKADKWRNDYEDFAARLEAVSQSEATRSANVVEPFINGLGW